LRGERREEREERREEKRREERIGFVLNSITRIRIPNFLRKKID